MHNMVKYETEVFPVNFEDVEFFGYSNAEVLDWLNKVLDEKVLSLQLKNNTLFLTFDSKELMLSFEIFARLVKLEVLHRFIVRFGQLELDYLKAEFARAFVKFLSESFCPDSRKLELIECQAFLTPKVYSLELEKNTCFFQRRHLSKATKVDSTTRSLVLPGTRTHITYWANGIIDEDGNYIKDMRG